MIINPEEIKELRRQKNLKVKEKKKKKKSYEIKSPFYLYT